MHQHARKCTGISCHDGHAQSVGSVGMDSNGQDGDGTGRRTCCVRGAKRQPGGWTRETSSMGEQACLTLRDEYMSGTQKEFGIQKRQMMVQGSRALCWAAEHGSRQVHAASVLPRQRPTVAQAPNCR
ncbi:hypothetical protein ABPG77_004326 [Micractinium sp. CCAP 211/92]